MSAKQLQTQQTVLVLLSLWQVGRGHTDITHQHYILLHAQVNVLYKESDLRETLLERLSQNIWDCMADPRGHGQLMLLKGLLTATAFHCFCVLQAMLAVYVCLALVSGLELVGAVQAMAWLQIISSLFFKKHVVPMHQRVRSFHEPALGMLSIHRPRRGLELAPFPA